MELATGTTAAGTRKHTARAAKKARPRHLICFPVPAFCRARDPRKHEGARGRGAAAVTFRYTVTVPLAGEAGRRLRRHRQPLVQSAAAGQL